MRKSKKVRRYTESEITKLAGKTLFVELNMPSSKYHKSILKTIVPHVHYGQRWLSLDAKELPRRLVVNFECLYKTTETATRLTNSPTILADEVFKDFSGRECEVGDVLFGDGKLIKITDIKPTIAVVKVLHPTSKWLQKTFRYRATSIKKFLYIEDPTLVLLKT